MTFSPANMPRRRVDHANQRANVDHPLTGEGFTLSGHAHQQARAKGWDPAEVKAAADSPSVTYENGRFPDQHRHIRGDIVAVVHRPTNTVVTAYRNVQETDLRPDQSDADAQRYGARRQQRG